MYTSVKLIQAKELKEELAVLELEPRQNKLKIESVKEKLKPLESFLDDARIHRQSIKEEISMF